MSFLSLLFIRLKKVSSLSSLFNVFNRESVLDFVKCIFCTYWDDHVWFSFYPTNWWTAVINFQILNHTCIPAINLTWQWHIILFYGVRFSLQYFIEDFCINIHKKYWSVIFFSCTFLFAFGIQVYWPLRMSWKVFPFVLLFRRVWGILTILYVW